MSRYRYNFFLLTRTLFLSFWYADWKGSYERGNILGLIWEFFRSLLGLNTWPFFIEGTLSWEKQQVQELFVPYGIAMWGWGYYNGRFYFRVKYRQARWAEYILLTNGVPVVGKLLGGYSPNQPEGTQELEDQAAPSPNSSPSQGRTEPTFRPIQEINQAVEFIRNHV